MLFALIARITAHLSNSAAMWMTPFRFLDDTADVSLDGRAALKLVLSVVVAAVFFSSAQCHSR